MPQTMLQETLGDEIGTAPDPEICSSREKDRLGERDSNVLVLIHISSQGLQKRGNL